MDGCVRTCINRKLKTYRICSLKNNDDCQICKICESPMLVDDPDAESRRASTPNRRNPFLSEPLDPLPYVSPSTQHREKSFDRHLASFLAPLLGESEPDVKVYAH